TARSPCASTAACWQLASTRRIPPASIPASWSTTSIPPGSSPSSLRNSSSAMPLASPARSLPAVRRTVSTPARPCGPPPCHPGKADISTWGRSGHFYFVLTWPPPPRAALFRQSRSRRSSPEPSYTPAAHLGQARVEFPLVDLWVRDPASLLFRSRRGGRRERQVGPHGRHRAHQCADGGE